MSNPSPAVSCPLKPQLQRLASPANLICDSLHSLRPRRRLPIHHQASIRRIVTRSRQGHPTIAKAIRDLVRSDYLRKAILDPSAIVRQALKMDLQGASQMHICGTVVELLGRAERSQCLISGAPKGAGLDGEGADRAMILGAAIPLAIGQCPRVRYQFFTDYCDAEGARGPGWKRLFRPASMGSVKAVLQARCSWASSLESKRIIWRS
jgi:hypothetical protein